MEIILSSICIIVTMIFITLLFFVIYVVTDNAFKAVVISACITISTIILFLLILVYIIGSGVLKT